MVETVTYNSQVIEGTPERPGKPRYVWEIESVNPLPAESFSESGHELFFLVQRVAGSWVHSEQLHDYQVEYIPRPRGLPPVQRLQLAYLDDTGSIQNELHQEHKK